jgi:exosome complex RNA-binding protein Rrp4
MCLSKEITHIKSYFANVATVTARKTTMTRLPERHVISRYLKSENTYKITDVYIITVKATKVPKVITQRLTLLVPI